MIDSEYLAKIEQSFNCKPCHYCGKSHPVALRAISASQKAAQSAAISSTVVLFGNGDAVRISFSEETCDDFISLAKQFVLVNGAHFVKSPFDDI